MAEFAVNLDTRVHRKPSPNGYSYRRKFTETALLKPTLVPGLAVRLADLGSELS